MKILFQLNDARYGGDKTYNAVRTMHSLSMTLQYGKRAYQVRLTSF